MGTIYLGYPAGDYADSPAALVAQCVSHPEWYDGWKLLPQQYKSDASLIAKDFCAPVFEASGPIILPQPVRNTTTEDVRRRLGSRVPILLEIITTIEELRAVIENAIEMHNNGTPMLALDLIVAFLMLRKLDQELMWAGYAKSYMWASDIPKGRGLDVKFSHRVPEVLNILFMRDLIVNKTSNGKKKYALNPERREEIYEILRNRKFPKEIEAPLIRHAPLENIRELDLLDCYGPPKE